MWLLNEGVGVGVGENGIARLFMVMMTMLVLIAMVAELFTGFWVQKRCEGKGSGVINATLSLLCIML